MEKEILGTIYTGMTDDFQRGLYPIARTIKADQHDLAVVVKESRGGASDMESAILTPKRTEYGKAIRKKYESGAIKESRHNMTELESRNDGMSNTITTVQKDNLVLEVKQIGNLTDNAQRENPQRRRVYDTDGCCPTINTCQGGQREPKIICAMRGRNPDNPSDRTAGSTTEQRLEPNSQGICNTLTSVQKDNMVLEKCNQYRIRKLTPLECWRLMDFSDEDFHKAESVNSNSQLYKQAGNSIVRNVLVAIFGQLFQGKENLYMKKGTRQ